MNFRTAMCDTGSCSGSSDAARNFLRAGSPGVAIFPCESGRDEVQPAGRLAAAFDKGGAERVTRAVPSRRFAGRPVLAALAGLVPGFPLMHPKFYIRLAQVEEAAALSDLCFRSKAM